MLFRPPRSRMNVDRIPQNAEAPGAGRLLRRFAPASPSMLLSSGVRIPSVPACLRFFRSHAATCRAASMLNHFTPCPPAASTLSMPTLFARRKCGRAPEFHRWLILQEIRFAAWCAKRHAATDSLSFSFFCKTPRRKPRKENAQSAPASLKINHASAR